MSIIKIGAQVTAKARPTKVTVSGTFQGYELEDQENPTSICGKVFYIKDGKQHLAHVYIDSIEACDSEDEEIRKEIISAILSGRVYDTDLIGVGHIFQLDKEVADKWIAYLEKQKEQKPIPKFKVGDRIYDKKDSYNRNVIREVGKDYYINAFAQKMDMAYTDANFEFLEYLDNDPTSNKPAEWSEGTKKTLDEISDYLKYKGREEDADFIRHLRPQSHWKPSEYTLSLVKKVANGEMLTHMEQMAMETLCNDLQKLL